VLQRAHGADNTVKLREQVCAFNHTNGNRWLLTRRRALAPARDGAGVWKPSASSSAAAGPAAFFRRFFFCGVSSASSKLPHLCVEQKLLRIRLEQNGPEVTVEQKGV